MPSDVFQFEKIRDGPHRKENIGRLREGLRNDIVAVAGKIWISIVQSKNKWDNLQEKEMGIYLNN